MTLELKDFKSFISGQPVKNVRDQSNADSFIRANILQRYKVEAEQALKTLKDVDDKSLQQQIQTLVKRWTQIEVMLEKALEAIQSQEYEIT